MSYGICLISTKPPDHFLSKEATSGLLTVDGVTVIALITLGGLILGGVIPFPSHLQVLKVGLGWGTISMSFLMLFVDGTVAMTIFSVTYPPKEKPAGAIKSQPTIVLVGSSPAQPPASSLPLLAPQPRRPTLLSHEPSASERELKHLSYERQILAASKRSYTQTEIGNASAVAAHRLLGQLHLGNHMTITGNSRNDFAAIISVCPLEDLRRVRVNITFDEIEDRLEGKTTWHHVGRSIGDSQMFWWHLVHDCTHPDSQLALTETSTNKVYSDPAVYARKIVPLKTTPVVEWFEQIFKVMDTAVFEDKKILIHCFAGRSRSVAVVIAYLMNRFNVPYQQAVYYVQSVRACAFDDPVFHNDLIKYETILRTARSRGAKAAAYCHPFN